MDDIKEILERTLNHDIHAIAIIENEISRFSFDMKLYDAISNFYKMFPDNPVSVYIEGLIHICNILGNGGGDPRLPYNYNKSEECFHKASKLGLSSADVKIGLGYIHNHGMSNNNYEMEIKYHLDKAIKLNNPMAYDAWALYHEFREDDQKAYECHLKAVETGATCPKLINKIIEYESDMPEHFEKVLLHKFKKQGKYTFENQLMNEIMELRNKLDNRKILNDVANGKKSLVLEIVETYI